MVFVMLKAQWTGVVIEEGTLICLNNCLINKPITKTLQRTEAQRLKTSCQTVEMKTNGETAAT